MEIRRTYPLILSLLLIQGSALGQACSIDLGADVTICQGETVTLTAPPGYPTYLWSTGSNAESITVGTTGTYWGEVSYPTGQLATNGSFSGGNTGFTTPFNYNTNLVPDGNYWIGTNAASHHAQFFGTGNGNFLMVNAGWMHAGWDVWCNTINVCPEQTYTLSVRAMSLASQGPPLLDWAIDGVQQGLWMQTGSQGSWSTFTNTWTSAPGQTSASFCVRIASGHGVGNDLGLDDISISSTIVLRDEVDVTVTPLPVVDLGPDATLCVGQNLVLDAGVPGGSYVWQDGSTASGYIVSAPGNYSVLVTADNCSASDAITVNYTPLPVVDLGPDLTLCTGQTVLLNAAVPGGSYVWQDGSTNSTFLVNGPGTYSVQVTASNCAASDAVDIAYNPTPVVDLGLDRTICAGEQVVLDATTPGATYLWQDGSVLPTFTANTTGTFSVQVTLNGCSASDAMDLTVTPLPVVDLGPDQTVCPGTDVVLDATIPGGTYLWQDGSGLPTFTASTSGVYSVQVTVNGCSASDSFTLSHFTLQTVDLGPNVTFCQGQSATIGSATPGATYLWNTGAITSDISVSVGGTYWLDVTLNGCVVRDMIDVSVTPLPIVDLGADLTICPGTQTTLDATLAGASYLWSTGAVTPTISVGPGSYSVTVTSNSCSNTDAIDISAWPTPMLDLGADVTLCPGDQLILDVTQPGASYLWQDGSVGPTFTATANGNYAVQLTDANGCIANDAINVSFAAPTPIDLGPDAMICQGTALNLDATVPGAIYLWNTGAITPTISASTTGTYSVVVTQGSCSVNDAIDVQVAALPMVNLGADVTLCPNEQIVLDATGPGLIYAWSTGVNTPTITVASAGTYSVTVTNAATCTASDAITIAYASPVPVDLGADLVICQGGAAILNATTPGASYLWNTGAVTATIAATTSGPYSVVVTQGSCTVADAVNVTVNPMPAVDLGADVTLCAGEDVVLDATWPGATYLWNTGAITPTLTATTTGNYSVTVSLNGCVANDAINVNVLTATSLDLGPDVTLCTGEQVVLDATTAGATYLWSTGAVTPTITVTTSGNYSVEVFSGMCSVTDAIDVTVNPMPAVDLGADVTLCAGEDVVLDATWPGATYLWNTGAITPTWTATTTGNYSVAVSLNGCVANDAINVNVLTATSLDLGPDVTLCTGEQVVLDATTVGATYLWSNGAVTPTITVTTSGNYSVEVFSGNCSVTDAVDVTFDPIPLIDLGPDMILCGGETAISLDVTWPDAIYDWNTGSSSPTIEVTASGSYSVNVDLNGCVVSEVVSVTFGSLDFYLGADTLLCPGEVLELSVDPANGVATWNDVIEASSYEVSAPGLYWVSIAGTVGCNAADTIVVVYADPGSVELGPDLVLCAGGSLELDASIPGGTYQWEDGSTDPVRTILASGNYAVDVTVGQCVVSDAIEVTFNPLPIVELGPDVALCPGTMAVFDATTVDATYLWQDGSTAAQYVTNVAEIISVTVTVDGCSSTDQAVVTALIGPSIELGADTTLCEGASLLLDLSNSGSTLLWEDGSTAATRSITTAGVFWVDATLNTCVLRDSITVSIFSPDALDLGPDQLLCSGTTVVLDASFDGATYAWSTGATTPTLTVGQPGSYGVTVSFAGCVAQDQVDVDVLTLSVPDLGPDVTICEGSSTILSIQPNGASILWSTGATTTEITVTEAGSYTVTLDSLGCQISDAVNVVHTPLISEVDLGSDIALCTGAHVVLEAQPILGASYVWNTGTSGRFLYVDQPGAYTITAQGNCIDAVATIVVSPEDCGTYVYVPNSFTPNNDGINDRFLPSLAGPVDVYELNIFDRWGERIHTTADRYAGWDGTYNGVLSQDGVYVWTLDYRVLGPNGVKSERLVGHVTLLR